MTWLCPGYCGWIVSFTADMFPVYIVLFTADMCPVYIVLFTADMSPVYIVLFTADMCPVYIVLFTADMYPQSTLSYSLPTCIQIGPISWQNQYRALLISFCPLTTHICPPCPRNAVNYPLPMVTCTNTFLFVLGAGCWSHTLTVVHVLSVVF